MSENDSRPTPLVPMPLVQFVDRTLEAERRLMAAELRCRDAALEAHMVAEDLRHEAGDAKIQKANEVLDYRLEEMNNFRSQINQERTEYVRREMYDREHAALGERVKTLEIVRGEYAGKTAAYASITAFVVIAAQVVVHFWK